MWLVERPDRRRCPTLRKNLLISVNLSESGAVRLGCWEEEEEEAGANDCGLSAAAGPGHLPADQWGRGLSGTFLIWPVFLDQLSVQLLMDHKTGIW